MALSDELADDVGSDEGVRAGDECVWHIEDDGFKELTRMIELMIALRKSKDLESVWLFNRVLVKIDFDFRLMNYRYSGEEERPLSQKAAGLYTFRHWGHEEVHHGRGTLQACCSISAFPRCFTNLGLVRRRESEDIECP